jgi:Arc/MetJ family transcription regulator
MLTNIDLDEATVETAMRLTGERTKRAVVRRALEELIRIERLRQLRRTPGRCSGRANLAELREESTANGTTRRHKRAR